MEWEAVYRRNSVERIKRDRPPLLIRDEVPALVALGYERMPEEDVVRLQLWGPSRTSLAATRCLVPAQARGCSDTR